MFGGVTRQYASHFVRLSTEKWAWPLPFARAIALHFRLSMFACTCSMPSLSSLQSIETAIDCLATYSTAARARLLRTTRKLLLKVQLKCVVQGWSELCAGSQLDAVASCARGLSSHYAESRAERDNETMSAMSQFQFLVAFAACESRASRIYCAPKTAGASS